MYVYIPNYPKLQEYLVGAPKQRRNQGSQECLRQFAMMHRVAPLSRRASRGLHSSSLVLAEVCVGSLHKKRREISVMTSRPPPPHPLPPLDRI
jgi:hypothetical protein